MLLVEIFYSNVLSLLLFKHNHNRVYNHNLCTIQYTTSYSDTEDVNFQRVCAYSLNLMLLSNIATSGEVQLTFVHNYVRNK